MEHADCLFILLSNFNSTISLLSFGTIYQSDIFFSFFFCLSFMGFYVCFNFLLYFGKFKCTLYYFNFIEMSSYFISPKSFQPQNFYMLWILKNNGKFPLCFLFFLLFFSPSQKFFGHPHPPMTNTMDNRLSLLCVLFLSEVQ